MPTNEQLTRLVIFFAVGYLCAGIVISSLAGIPFWVSYFDSDFTAISLMVIGAMVCSGVVGIVLMRTLVKRYGVQDVLKQDTVVMLIGLLFLGLAFNKAMLLIGLIVSSASLAVYFYENYKTQVDIVAKGGMSIITLCGWAIGPCVAIAVLSSFQEYGLICLRLLFVHYAVLAFWVWIQRLALHTDYSDVPRSLAKLDPHNKH